MIKILKNIPIYLIMAALITIQSCYAHNYGYHKPFPSKKEQNSIDKMLEQRLQLTKEQVSYLQSAKPKNRKEIENAVKKMQEKHDEIVKVYMLGLPKWQSDLRTAPIKAELVILKQNTAKIKEKHRKDFESILTPEQKAEFENIKKEFNAKKVPSNR